MVRCIKAGIVESYSAAGTTKNLCMQNNRSIRTCFLNDLLDKNLQSIYKIIMDPISFSWDDSKNETNQKKHKVSFGEAQTVFFDEKAIEYFDPDHSEGENRFLMLCLSYHLRILVVSFTLRNDDTEIRIISARKATKKEQRAYPGVK